MKKEIIIFILLAILASCVTQTSEDSKVKPAVNIAIKSEVKNETSEVAKRNIIISLPIQSKLNEIAVSKNQAVFGEANELSDLYNKLEKVSQVFIILPNKDTTLVCKEGTSLRIKAKSFVSEKTGKDVIGNIRISIKEYYKLSDIILAKLSTRTQGNLLETAGMVNITASADGESCSLKQGQKIEIGFPRKDEKEGMQIYLGDWKSKSQINWDVVPESKDLNNVYDMPDIQPSFPGGQTQMMKFVSSNIRYPESAKNKGIQGVVNLGFCVERDGKISNLRVLRGIDAECDQEALRVVKQFPRFSPAKSGDENVRTNFLLPIRFSLGDNIVETNADYKKNFENKYNEATIQTAGVNELTRYIFSTTKLGWINCDRLWKNQNTPRVDYIVNVGEYKSSNVGIVFHSYKSIYSGLPLSTDFSFHNVPVGEDITIVAIKYINNKPYLAIKETKTSSLTFKDLDFQSVTNETLRSKMKELDKLD